GAGGRRARPSLPPRRHPGRYGCGSGLRWSRAALEPEGQPEGDHRHEGVTGELTLEPALLVLGQLVQQALGGAGEGKAEQLRREVDLRLAVVEGADVDGDAPAPVAEGRAPAEAGVGSEAVAGGGAVHAAERPRR